MKNIIINIMENIIIIISSWLLSLVITIIALYINNKNEKNKIITKYVEELYKERLKNYPDLIDITQNIWKTIDSYKDSKKVLQVIKMWKNSLIYTENTFKYYNDLKKVLRVIPEIKWKIYSEKQRKKIWIARNNFRFWLRNDIELGHKFKKFN